MNHRNSKVLSFPSPELVEAQKRIRELETALEDAKQQLAQTKEEYERRIEGISLEADLAIQKIREETQEEIARIRADAEGKINMANAVADHFRWKAFRSEVTDLPNRGQLSSLFRHEERRRTGEPVAKKDITERGKSTKKQKIYRKIPFCLVIIDLNDFKSINDSLGHPVGDNLLRQFGDFLSESSRFKEDVVFHLSGDEFALFLDDTNLTQGRKLLSRIQRDLRRHTFIVRKGTQDIFLHLTASMGIAKYKLGMTFEELFEAADDAMYTEKNKGRGEGEV